MEGARIYAQVWHSYFGFTKSILILKIEQNVIREKNQSLNFLKLGSRIDAVASRLETAIRMQEVGSYIFVDRYHYLHRSIKPWG